MRDPFKLISARFSAPDGFVLESTAGIWRLRSFGQHRPEGGPMDGGDWWGRKPQLGWLRSPGLAGPRPRLTFTGHVCVGGVAPLSLPGFERNALNDAQIALSRWAAAIPLELRKSIAAVTGRTRDAIQFAEIAPQTLSSLVLQSPALTTLVTHQIETLVPTLKENESHTLRQTSLLHGLGLGDRRWLARALARMPTSRRLPSLLPAMRKLVVDPARCRLWMHTEAMTLDALEVLCRLRGGLRLTPKVLSEFAQLGPRKRRAMKNRLLNLDRWLSAREQSKKLKALGALSDLEKRVEFTECAADARDRPFQPFPRTTIAALPGVIEPLCSAADLRREGEQMGHCVGSYVDSAMWGGSEFYRVLWPVRATVQLESTPTTVGIVQLSGVKNAEVSARHRAFIVDWAVGRTVEPWLERLLSMPKLRRLRLRFGSARSARAREKELRDFRFQNKHITRIARSPTLTHVTLEDRVEQVTPSTEAWVRGRFAAGDLRLVRGVIRPQNRAPQGTRWGSGRMMLSQSQTPCKIGAFNVTLGVNNYPQSSDKVAPVTDEFVDKCLAQLAGHRIDRLELRGCAGLTGSCLTAVFGADASELGLDGCAGLDLQDLQRIGEHMKGKHLTIGGDHLQPGFARHLNADIAGCRGDDERFETLELCQAHLKQADLWRLARVAVHLKLIHCIFPDDGEDWSFWETLEGSGLRRIDVVTSEHLSIPVVWGVMMTSSLESVCLLGG